MSTRHLFAATLLAIAAGAATANDADGVDPWGKFNNITFAPPVSRAQVLAELEIYRRSGLAELDRAEAPDTFSDAYRAASARYAAMRSSPEFAALVQRIAQRRGDAMTIAKPDAAMGSH